MTDRPAEWRGSVAKLTAGFVVLGSLLAGVFAFVSRQA